MGRAAVEVAAEDAGLAVEVLVVAAAVDAPLRVVAESVVAVAVARHQRECRAAVRGRESRRADRLVVDLDRESHRACRRALL